MALNTYLLNGSLKMATLTDLQTYPFQQTNKENGEIETHFGVGFRLDSVTLNIGFSDFSLVRYDYQESTNKNIFSFGAIRATLTLKESQDILLEMLAASKLQEEETNKRLRLK